MSTTQTHEKPEKEELYKEIVNFLRKICHDFQTRYGGCVDDYMSHINMIYVKAYERWDPVNCNATRNTYFKYWLWNSLLDIYRTQWSRASKHHAEVEDEVMLNIEASENSSFIDMESMELLLSDDGFMVLSMLLKPEPGLDEEIQSKGGQPRNYKSTIKACLRAIGWGKLRIEESFDEVKVALFAPEKHPNNEHLGADCLGSRVF